MRHRPYSKASLAAALQNTSDLRDCSDPPRGPQLGRGWFPSCNDKLLIFFDGFRAYFRRPFSSVASLLNHESKSCKALRLHRKTSDQTVSYIAFIPVSPSGFFFYSYLPIGWRLLP
nr:MAG TPA: hypothetical protein [Caudoviricetes sp.]